MRSDRLPPLPVDGILDDCVTALAAHGALVVQAPPGSGKTTRLPLALLSSVPTGRIVMLEPRRLAAVHAASYMARLLGEEAGRTVGYTIRFDSKVSAVTRIEIVTEGVLARRIQRDPALEGTSVLVFDEFHERSLDADLSLALARDVQLNLRADLKIVVMSATIDTERISGVLGGAPVVSCGGTVHPVSIGYREGVHGERLESSVAAAVGAALRETPGDVLVFLPGVAEIRRCGELLDERYGRPGTGVSVKPLYGELPFDRQRAAIAKGEGRKVVLATNIAETSLTIEGVTAVVDSGLVRQLRFDPGAGINRLVTVRESRASAAQRAGRAGRLGPGRCYRLFSEYSHNAMMPFAPPEISVADLTPFALSLACWGVADPTALHLVDQPPAQAYAEGKRLLFLLDALDETDRVTPLGRRMNELPVHPRVARMLLRGDELGAAGTAADLAALLSERDIVRRAGSDIDILRRLDLFHAWRSGKAANVDTSACAVADKAAQQFRRSLGARNVSSAVESATVGRLLCRGWPDRVGSRRPGSRLRYVLAAGTGAAIPEKSDFSPPPFTIAPSVALTPTAGGDAVVHLCYGVTKETLLDELAGSLRREREVLWDEQAGRIAAFETVKLGAAMLEQKPFEPSDDERTSALCAIVSRHHEYLYFSAAARQFQARVALLRTVVSERQLPDIADAALFDAPERWLAGWLTGVKSRADLERIDLLAVLKSLFTHQQLRLIDEGAPLSLDVPSGRRCALDYTAPDGPVLAVKLQELFGCADTPTIGFGRLPVLLHLLSPAGRPVQVTRDLKGFWNGTYHDVKKELKGRYPKHPWPDDPWTAPPTAKTKKRTS